jgi:hypothetical protein
MAYEIKIIGENNPIILNNEQGLKVITLYESKTIPNDTKINLGDVIRTSKGQIRNIRKVEDSASSNKRISQVAEDVEKVHKKEYLNWKVKSPEQKSERLTLFREVFKVLHDRHPEPEEEIELKKDLSTFFKEQPQRTYADPVVYLKHLKDNKQLRDKKVDKHKSVMLRLFERVLVCDMIDAR